MKSYRLPSANSLSTIVEGSEKRYDVVKVKMIIGKYIKIRGSKMVSL
jgi:hypothetical protein